MRIAISALCMLVSACAGSQREPLDVAAAAAIHPASPPGTNRWSEPARKVLIEHCGACHLGSLPTANRRAMAIYDLAEDKWDARLTPGNYPGITRRVNRQATEEQKRVIEKYLRCARDRDCEAA